MKPEDVDSKDDDLQELASRYGVHASSVASHDDISHFIDKDSDLQHFSKHDQTLFTFFALDYPMQSRLDNATQWQELRQGF